MTMFMSPHDRRRWQARIAIGTLILLLACASLALRLYLSAPTDRSPRNARTDSDFGIERVVSTSDADSDGLDDQSDILQSTRAYLATRPVYESAYYDGGYPTDGKGVCTDVVAAGLLGAGYDLRTLVDEDIRRAPEAYDVDVPDPNIDYRRVRNLRVWFDRHAISLTCDTTQIDQWAGGDIVCYRNHIGIVSDSRDSDGIPYILHHRGRFQLRFEEDCLADYGEIVGHWRIG